MQEEVLQPDSVTFVGVVIMHVPVHLKRAGVFVNRSFKADGIQVSLWGLDLLTSM